MSAVQKVLLQWQVTTVEEYSAIVSADDLTVGALPEVVSFPEAGDEHLAPYLAEREGSAHGYLTSETTSRTITSVVFEEDFAEDPTDVDQFAG